MVIVNFHLSATSHHHFSKATIWRKKTLRRQKKAGWLFDEATDPFRGTKDRTESVRSSVKKGAHRVCFRGMKIFARKKYEQEFAYVSL